MNVADLASSTAWRLAGWTMLHYLWVGSLLGGFAAIGRLTIRPGRVEARYAQGLVSLILLAIAPAVIAAWLVANRPTLAPEVPPGTIVALGPAAIDPTPIGPAGRAGPGPMVIDPTFRAPRADSAEIAGDRHKSDEPDRSTLATIAGILPSFWVLGAPLTFAYLGLGLAGAERLRRGSIRSADPRLLGLVERLGVAVGLARRVVLATSDRVAAPVLIGVIRPAILLPTAALVGWDPEQLEWAILHELIHVRRHDNLTLLCQRFVESALFFHPAVWLVSGWVHRDRELCCDTAVVRVAGRPRAYAKALLALADPAKPAPRRPTALAMAESPLVDRIRRLLQRPPESTAMKFPRVTIALAASALLVPAALLAAWSIPSPPDDPPGRATPLDADDRARLLEVAEAAWREVEPRSRELGTQSLCGIAGIFADLGDRVTAVAILRRAREVASEAKVRVEQLSENSTRYLGLSSADALSRVAAAQSGLGDRDGALETLRSAIDSIDKSLPITFQLGSYAEIARQATTLGDTDLARKAARLARRDEAESDHNSWDGDIVPDLASTRISIGDIESAFALLDGIGAGQKRGYNNQQAISVSLRQIALALVAYEPEAARPVLERVFAEYRRIDIPSIRGTSADAISDAFARIGDQDSALKVARMLDGGDGDPESDHSRSSIDTLMRISKIYRKAGAIDEARRLLRDAYAASVVPGASGPSSSLAGAMVKVNDIEGALRCVEHLEVGDRFRVLVAIAEAQKSVDSVAARATLIRAIAEAKAAKLAGPSKEFLASRERRDDEPIPDQPNFEEVQTENQVKVRAMMGDFQAARELADAISDPSWHRFALADVARLQAASGDPIGALDWSRDHEISTPRPNFLEAVLHGIGDLARADEDRP